MQFNKHTHTHTHTQLSLISPWEDHCEWHRMIRMTGPDCAVMCNLINTHTHTHTTYSPLLACHKIWSRSFVNTMIACKHTCGSMTGCAGGGSLWNRAFVKASVRACTPPVQYFLLGVSRRTKTSWTLWSTLPRKRGRGGGDQSPECFKLMTPES